MMRRKLGSVILLTALALSANAAAVPVEPSRATPAQRDEAQAHFVRGKQLYDAKHYDEAAGEFRAAMDIVATPNARLYLARCDRETGKLVEAYTELASTAAEAQAYASQDARYEKTATAATAEHDALASQLGFVTIHVEHATDTTRLVINDKEVTRATWGEPQPVMPGNVTIVVHNPPSRPFRQSLTVAAGERKEATIWPLGKGPPAEGETTQPATPAPSESHGGFDRATLRPYAYVAGGVGAAGLLTFVVAGLLSNGTYSDLQTNCRNGACPSSFSSEISRGKTEQTIANVGLVVGLVGAAAGVTLFVLSMPSKQSQAGTGGVGGPARTTSAGLVVGPWTGVRGVF